MMATSLLVASCNAGTGKDAEASAAGPVIGKSDIKIENGRMTPEALWAFGRIGGMSVSPDGKKVAYTVSYYSVAENKGNSEVYVMNADGSENRRITETPFSESNVAWIKGGSKIAFLCAEGGSSQLWEMNPDGTGRKRLSNYEKDIEGFAFSPDETKVLFISQVKTVKSTAEKYPDLDKTTGRVITDLMYKHWDEWVTTAPHPFVADFDGERVTNPVDIMEGELFESPMKPFGGIEQLAWNTTSDKVAYTSRKKTGKAYSLSTNSDIYVYDLKTKQTVNMTEGIMGYDTNPTYPSRFLIPADFSDEDFEVVCKYRSKGRVPVPVWRHPTTNAVLCRSAQPMVGLKMKKSSMDEKLVRKLMGCCGASTKHYYFVDARSYIAAMGNQSMGKGTENPANYPGSEIFFMNIANIHAARDSLQKMSDLFNPDVYKGDDDNFFKMLADAKWYEQVRTILCAIARSVELLEDNGCSILSHCSDGWDRTAQMVAGTELMLDPYYRTLVGFEILIEKEWCSFGHQFRRRFGQDNANADDEQRSPVFILWLDCVYQAMQQFPTAFEFNEEMLLCINEHVYSGKFGTFLFDCEAKRFEFQAKERTLSLWSFINDPVRIDTFKNPNYVRCETTLRLDASSKHLRIWRNLWDKYDPSITPKKHTKYYC